MADTDTETADIVGIVDRYGGDPGMLIPMMQDVQEECGYLPQTELKKLSGKLELPISRIYSVASFYSSFRLMPKGDHTIQLCMGTVCFLKGAGQISEAIQKEFNLVPGGTSEDRKFTYSPVNCVGACALAPVMVVDGEYFGGVTVDSAIDLLHDFADGKVVAGASAAPTQDPKAKPEPKKKKKKKKAAKAKKTDEQQGGEK